MPGVIMENGDRVGSHTNHDRDKMANGINGSSGGADRHQETTSIKGGSEQLSNRDDQQRGIQDRRLAEDLAQQISNLPPLPHISEGFLSLTKLLERRAQVSHNTMDRMIQTLAGMPTPQSATNGNGSHTSAGTDDSSADGLAKKVALLKYAEKEHADWVKTLVITNWSRVSGDIQKLIDLKVYIEEQRLHFQMTLHEISELKRGLVHARLPNPDLKTAVEVLSTGKASWMPEFGYIEPPKLTAKELNKTQQDLNTLLSIRLNLQDHDIIPYHFRNFTIKSGRVTFTVEGEFEVDLTIADENPESQFWFIDFRFLFHPVISIMPEQLRSRIEHSVNAVLERDGLVGAYKNLHELTLTHKISELRRQAMELSRGRWINSLEVEPIHRALSIQYWVDRFGPDAPRSWIILGVHSGRKNDGKEDFKATSKIFMKWIRDGKEVNDFDIPLDLTEISTETLLQNVIQQHTLHILNDIYVQLRTKNLFQKRSLALFLKVSESEPSQISLELQLTQDTINLAIHPVSGRFAISGGSRQTWNTEGKLNSQMRDAAAIAYELENLRCVMVSEKIMTKAVSLGWTYSKNPGIQQQELKVIVPRDTLQMSWLRRPGWTADWIIAFTASMSGERFWLFQTTGTSQAVKIRSYIRIPTLSTTPPLTHSFFSALHLLAASLVTFQTNLRALHQHKVPYRILNKPSTQQPGPLVLPVLFAKLSQIVQPSSGSRPWAKDILKMTFHGLETSNVSAILDGSVASGTEGNQPEPVKQPPVEDAVIVAQAMMTTPMPASFNVVKKQVDKDIAFHPSSGAFAVRIHQKMGESAFAPLKERLSRVEQLVRFVGVAKKHSRTLRLENISLGKANLSYGKSGPGEADSGVQQRHLATINFGKDKKAMSISFDVGNPHLRVVDSFTKILNSHQGLDGVATMLPITLPLLRAYGTIEDAWADLYCHGDALLLTRAIDWHVIRYTFIPQTAEQTLRKVDIEIRLQHRRKEAWWSVRRTHPSQQKADFADKALAEVWDGNADGDSNWRGMHGSAIARDNGIENVLSLIDGVMRRLAANGMETADEAVKVEDQQNTQGLQGQNKSAPVANMGSGRAQGQPNVPQHQKAQMTGQQARLQQQQMLRMHQGQQEQRKKNDAIVID